MPYKIFSRNKYTGALSDIDEEVYETKADAEDAIPEMENAWLTGIEVLEWANEPTSDPNDIELVVKRV